MAIRVRCTGCNKKVSVDDAFAGGACRCPYCKEIILVGGELAQTSGTRPYAPVERPDTPDEAPPGGEGQRPLDAREVPMANPVHVQGILILVLMGLALVLIAAAIWLGMSMSSASKEEANQPAGASAAPGQPGPVRGGPATPTASPAPAGPNIAGIKIAAPVIYVVDCGGSMKNVFDFARYMTRLSVRSLGAGGNFDIVLSAEAGEKSLGGAGGGAGGNYRKGGPEGDAAAKPFLEVSPEGTCNIEKALEAAIARRPKTIVLLRRGPVAGAKELADKAKAANVTIVAVGLASDSEAKESLSALTGPTGGQTQVFSEAALSSWADQQPPLE
jgi:hypothetical protein